MCDEDMSTQPNREPSWRKYVDEQSRSVATIRDKGFSVWSLIGQYRVYRGDAEQMLGAYGGHLTAGELDAALAYYWAKPHSIDEKLREISGDEEGSYVGAVSNGMSMQRNEEQPWFKYIDEESRNIAIVRDKGMSVWSLVRYLRVYKGDKERVLAGYDGELTIEELEAALDYYWANPEAIDRKLKEIST